jgi:phospholipid/cholesterol/gamma-HCH transport system substrate-binding protein
MKEEIKAGIIIVTSFLVLSALVVLIGGSRLFEKIDKYYVKVTNAAGLETGSQVKLGGVRVGRVLSIAEPAGPGRPLTIEIGLKKGTPVYKGTKALITQIGFVGDIYLLLAVDRTTEGKIEPGGEIPAEEATDFAKMMTKLEGLSQTVDSLVKDIDKLFTPDNIHEMEKLVRNTNKAIVVGTANIEQVSASLKSTTEKLGQVLAEVEDVVKTNKGEVSELIRKARQDLDRAGEMLRTIEAAAKSVDKVTGDVGVVVDRQGQNIDGLVDAMTRTAEELQGVLQEIRNKPWSVLYREDRAKGE